MTKQDFIWIYVNTLNSMEKDELKQLLIEFYRVATEESRMVGVQKIQVFTQRTGYSYSAFIYWNNNDTVQK
ncbi:MAG: hypothetical protein J7K61_06720 [Thermoplasmata archaeon]|nr:hypothetical protein [Thermoplasmata archaeon]